MMQQTPRRLTREPPLGEVPVLDHCQELVGAVAGVADLAPFVAPLAVVVHIFHVEHGLKKCVNLFIKYLYYSNKLKRDTGIF